MTANLTTLRRALHDDGVGQLPGWTPGIGHLDRCRSAHRSEPALDSLPGDDSCRPTIHVRPTWGSAVENTWSKIRASGAGRSHHSGRGKLPK